MSSNKIISYINALSEQITIDNINDVVCIDTTNNRIGIKTASPKYALDISGNADDSSIRCNILKINEINSISSSLDFTSNVNFTSGVNFQNDISIDNNLDVSNFLHVHGDVSINNTLDVSNFLYVHGDVSINNTLDVSNFLYVRGDASIDNNLDVSNFLHVYGDASINNNLDVSNIVSSNNMIYINTISMEIIGNLTISGNIDVKGIYKQNNKELSNNTIDIANENFANIISDDRLKHNEIAINNGLEIIRQLQPQFYQKTKTFKDIDFSGILNEPYTLEAGLIAQEVLEISDISYTVFLGNESTPYSLNYNNLFVYGLAAIKELDNIINNKNSSLENISLENVNLENIQNLIKSQNMLINNMNNKINYLESKINNIEAIITK